MAAKADHEESASVLAVTPGLAQVRSMRGEACRGCAAGGGCSHLGSRREATVWALDPLGVAVGDRVVVAVPEGAALRAGWLLLFAPAAVLLVGAALGHRLAPLGGLDRDLGAALLGGAGLAAALLAARRAGRHPGVQPRVVRKV